MRANATCEITLSTWPFLATFLFLKCKWTLSSSCRFASTCMAPAVELILFLRWRNTVILGIGITVVERFFAPFPLNTSILQFGNRDWRNSFMISRDLRKRLSFVIIKIKHNLTSRAYKLSKLTDYYLKNQTRQYEH